MNRTLLISVLVLIIVVLAIGAYWWTHLPGTNSPPPQQTDNFPTQTEQRPDDFAGAFYKWYLNASFETDAEKSAALAQWLTPDFVSNFSTIAENTDQDPIIIAQDTYPSWYTNLTAQAESQSSSDSVVRVVLGTGTETHALNVHLTKMGSTWRIAGVTEVN